jgi:flagellar biosynthesis chaperone FliJ
MRKHATHHDDCGCKSAQYEETIKELRNANAQLEQENKDLSASLDEVQAMWAESRIERDKYRKLISYLHDNYLLSKDSNDYVHKVLEGAK